MVERGVLGEVDDVDWGVSPSRRASSTVASSGVLDVLVGQRHRALRRPPRTSTGAAGVASRASPGDGGDVAQRGAHEQGTACWGRVSSGTCQAQPRSRLAEEVELVHGDGGDTSLERAFAQGLVRQDLRRCSR